MRDLTISRPTKLATGPAPPAPPAAAGDRRALVAPFAALLLAMLLASLDQTIVATALPTIVGDLGSINDVSWVVTAYLLTSTVTTPIWGRISDIYGRKHLFMGAIALFVGASALCGTAQSLTELVAFRALQGIAAGGLMTLAMAIVGDLVSPRERGRYQGYIQMVFVLASVAGPLLGGLFTDHASWRWVFYVNLPVGALALTLAATRLKLERGPGTEHRVDYTGAALLAAGVAALILVTVWGGQEHAWTSPTIVGMLTGGIAALAAFVVVERRAAEPILPLRLFAAPSFVRVSAVLFLTTCAFFAAIVFLPVYLQVVTGVDATTSGLLLLPLMLGATTSAMVSGRLIAKTGHYKRFPVAGLAIMALGLFGLGQLDTDTSRLFTAACMVVFGLGFGAVGQVLVLVVQNGAEKRDLGIATASANLFRALGGSVGAAAFGAVFDARLEATHAVAEALQTVFLVASGVALLAFLVVLALEEIPLRMGR